MTGIPDQMIRAGTAKAQEMRLGVDAVHVATLLSAALSIAPTVDGCEVWCPDCRSRTSRPVWACDGVVAIRDECERVDCPLEHHALIVGPAIEGDDL